MQIGQSVVRVIVVPMIDDGGLEVQRLAAYETICGTVSLDDLFVKLPPFSTA
jgi:hypothetical protein